MLARWIEGFLNLDMRIAPTLLRWGWWVFLFSQLVAFLTSTFLALWYYAFLGNNLGNVFLATHLGNVMRISLLSVVSETWHTVIEVFLGWLIFSIAKRILVPRVPDNPNLQR